MHKPVSSFANGVTKDKTAINAAITTCWSNGQTEGQITKLKLVKRQMYGRAKLDLLQARLTNRRYMTIAAPKLRQSPYSTPIHNPTRARSVAAASNPTNSPPYLLMIRPACFGSAQASYPLHNRVGQRSQSTDDRRGGRRPVTLARFACGGD